MALGDRFYRKARDKVEVRTGEQVELISMASRTGAMNAFVAGKLGSAALGTPEGVAPRSRMQTNAGGRGGRLPTTFMVALTPTAFRVFKFRRSWFGLKITNITPYVGFVPGIKAFTAAVLGGIGNITGALLGGILLGLLEAFFSGLLPYFPALGTGYSDIFAFAVLILILIFRPTGLLGQRVDEKV